MTDQAIIHCTLQPQDRGWRPDPFPGSAEAREQGCTCSSAQSAWPDALRFATDCPVHPLEHVAVS
jgi:hypothetical protein